jgi:hypothetical protein
MFQPILSSTGLEGWRFLSRTYDDQRQAFDKSSELTRDTDYFAAKIGAVSTAEELVSDRRLLRVALGAFGLEDDINAKALIQKVLEGGSIEPSSLANRLGDQRYRAFSKAFGFGDFATPRTVLSDFPNEIISAFRARSFETAVGNQDQSLRLALNAKRELASLATGSQSDTTKWFTILGTPPLREVFEAALGLPQSFRQLDIDRQLTEVIDRSASQLGITSLAQLADDTTLGRTIDRYLIRTQSASAGSLSSTNTALTLISAIPRANWG